MKILLSLLSILPFIILLSVGLCLLGLNQVLLVSIMGAVGGVTGAMFGWGISNLIKEKK